MKAFIISLSIVLALFILTALNSIFVNYTVSSLIEQAQSLQIGDDSVKKFANTWNEKQFFIRLSSSHEETHKIDEAVKVLEAKVQEGNASGFCEERALLVEYLTQILEDEAISFENII